ncbi:MAG: methyl-accepting chemotaxis protein [Nitrospirae bacterium]|nr:methyl-accepting chemotaxis protein [Nitrospirota bacterium]
MRTMIMRFFKEGKGKRLKDRIDASMGLKFMFALFGAVAVLMVMGSFFVARMLMDGQYRALETRGREMGQLLGKAGTDALLHRDIPVLDGLVAETVKSPDVLYTYIADSSNVILNNASVSFNRAHPDVKKLLAQGEIEDTATFAAKAKEKFDPVEVQVDVKDGDTRTGLVTMGFSRAAVRKDGRDAVLLLLGTSVLITGALALMIYLMVRSMIVLPAKEAVAVASNIAAGDLTQSMRVTSSDELGMLGRGLNRMTIGLKGMIENVREAARKTAAIWGEVKGTSQEITGGSKGQAEAVEEVASSVNEMHFALKEMADNVKDLYSHSETTSSSVIEMAASSNEVAKTIVQLSTAIEDTSTAIIQMSAAVRQIAENVEVLLSSAEDTAASATEISASVKEVESNAKESASLAEAVASDAKQLGMRSIEKTIEGMSRIETTARRTADVVNRLGERAENIGSILTVIEDITDQTGLLALNAAILAAQAGEHGKGFAVVAAEIRELANRTALSTQEIGKLITAVQEESREAVGVMREEVSLVEEGVRLARDASSALEKIVERADHSRDMSRSINKAATEQVRGVRQVSDAVDKINEMTHQISQAVNEQRQGSEQITRASEKMRELTRFIRSSTDEQARGSKDISAAVENMSAKIGMVNRAAGEVQAGSDLIVRSIERIKEIARSNADLAAGLNVAMDVMVKQSESLNKEISKFRTERA